jgi:putative SOS response-associated peptidase YedK
MCGRFLNRTPASETARIFGTSGPVPNLPARYNIAPTQTVLTVRHDAESGTRRLDLLRWGLVPFWAKDLKIGAQCINAKAETVAEKPAFREAFKHRRCLIPADGFYEWLKSGGTKVPHAIVPLEGQFAFAGLWERWKDRASGETVLSCSIVTGRPNALVAPIHDRMPAILPEAAWPLWLGEAPADRAALTAILERPYPAERMRAYPVSVKVNNVRNDEPALLEPV